MSIYVSHINTVGETNQSHNLDKGPSGLKVLALTNANLRKAFDCSEDKNLGWSQFREDFLTHFLGKAEIGVL